MEEIEIFTDGACRGNPRLINIETADGILVDPLGQGVGQQNVLHWVILCLVGDLARPSIVYVVVHVV